MICPTSGSCTPVRDICPITGSVNPIIIGGVNKMKAREKNKND